MLKTFLSALILFVALYSAPAAGETLSLADCIRSAATANPLVKAAAYEEAIAATEITLARSSNLPRIDFQGGYGAQKDPQAVSINGISFETQQADYGYFSFVLTQTLFDFGRTKAQLERAHALTEAAAHDFVGKEKEGFLQVVQSYFTILLNQKIRQAMDEEVRQMTEHLRVTQILYEQGVVTRNDLLQAEVNLASSHQRGLLAENRLENSWLNLDFLIGRPASYRADLDEGTVIPPVPEFSADDVPNRREEIKALRKIVEAGEHTAEEKNRAFYPEIFARLALDYVQNDKVREQTIMSATVGLKVNLFEGQATTGRREQSVRKLARDRELLNTTRDQIMLEYRTALNDVRVAAELIKVTEKAIGQGEENLRINRDRYQAQVGTATDVINAQTLLTKAKTDYYRATYDYQVSLARVRKAAGEL